MRDQDEEKEQGGGGGGGRGAEKKGPSISFKTNKQTLI